MDMPKKIYVNEFLDGSEKQWCGEHLEYIRADLVNELIAAVDANPDWSCYDKVELDRYLDNIDAAKNKLKALEAE